MRCIEKRLLAAACLALASSFALAQSAWHTMRGPDGSFTAELPAPPRYTELKLNTAKGTGFSMHQYLVQVGAAGYVVQSAVYPGDVDLTKPKANLQAGLDKASENMDGRRWTKIEWVDHQGQIAVDAAGTRQGEDVRTYMVTKGRQIVTLIYTGPAGSAHSSDVSRFIASLRLR